MALLQDYLKQQQKQSQNDCWTTREQLCLASAVAKNGDQNWVAVSRICKSLTSEENRPPDWYSTKNCAFQYAELLQKVDAPKRSREKGDLSANDTQGELVTKILVARRMEELKETIGSQKEAYEKLVKHINLLESGQVDERIDEIWEQTMQDQLKREEEEKRQEECRLQGREKKMRISPALRADPPHNTTPEANSSMDIVHSVVATSSDPRAVEMLPVVKIEEASEVVQDVVIRTEVVDVPEATSTPTEVVSELPSIGEVEAVVESVPNETDDNENLTVNLPSTVIQHNEPSEVGLEEAKPAEKPEPEMPANVTSPTTDQDVSEVTSAKAATEEGVKASSLDVYAFDSDPESSDKKGITGFSLGRDEPTKVDKYETFKSSRKRRRSFKDSHEELLEKSDCSIAPEPSAAPQPQQKDDIEEFEPPKKMRRNIKKEEDEENKRKVADVDDDEVSRDSAEVKEILMFVKSDRRRVYGHDDTASPVISESTPSSPASTYYGDDCDSEKMYKTWKKSVMLVWNDIAAHKNASVFLRPISHQKLPTYHSIIYKPTDLQTIKRQVETGVIKTTQEFEREMLLLFVNAKMYNPKDHNIYQMAQEMMKDCVALIQEFKNTQLFAKSTETPQKSLRRETRESSAKRTEVGIKRKRK